MMNSGEPETGRTDTPRIRELEWTYEAYMEEYCEWRRKQFNSHMLAEDEEYRRKLDQYRRQIASAKAAADDVESRMRLLDNWENPTEAGTRYEFHTAHGIYSLWVNEDTHVWAVRTPDGELEGPFSEAQEGADWAATDWYEVFRDPEGSTA